MNRTMINLFRLCLCAALAAGCAGPESALEPAPAAGKSASSPAWTKPAVSQALRAGKLSPQRARRTLAADGAYCASEANRAGAAGDGCGADFVFKCSEPAAAGLSGCTATVMGASCAASALADAYERREPAFFDCMQDIGWQPVQRGG